MQALAIATTTGLWTGLATFFVWTAWFPYGDRWAWTLATAAAFALATFWYERTH